MLEKLVSDWFSLLNYSKDKTNFDDEVFKTKHDSIAYKYKKLNYEQQGEFTHLIHEQLLQN